ncbi:MAG: hypothetical protein AAF732_12365 [Pseudomonadota bacterium]
MHKDTRAFLAIWNDVDPPHAAEWDRWHVQEHFPERVGIDGFLVGRRYLAMEPGETTYFTLYEGRDLHVFDGPAYLDRLNNPTPWTQKISPAFRNFIRGASRCVARTGLGDGGFLLAVRLTKDAGAGTPEDSNVTADAMAAEIMALDGIHGVAVGCCDPDVTLVETAERRRRSGTADAIYNAVVLIEALEPEPLGTQRDAICAAVRKHAPAYVIAGACRYQLGYRLSRSDL